MKILSIETSGKICAVALLENNNLIKEEIINDENTHSIKLMPLIDKILKENNISINEIDLFACDVGPGSFTGIRIGIATIKAFLDVTNKKAVGVTSLENLAYNIKKDGTICTLIDAKNDNVYCGLFEKINNNYKAKKEFEFSNINDILSLLEKENKQITFIGDGSIKYKELIKSKINNANFEEDKYSNLNARNIGNIAYIKLNLATDSNGLKPTYLRKSNAER